MTGGNRYGIWALVAGLVALAVVGTTGDFSSSRPRPIVSLPTAPEPLRAGPRPVRPIPEVISKPKPFRVADPQTAVRLSGGPQREVVQVVATTDVPATQRLSFPAAPFTAVPGRLAPPPSAVADASAAEAPEAAEIRSMMRDYLEAFNRHDTLALASHWSPAGESVDLDSGETTSGRDAVAGVFAALFDRDAAAAIDIRVESVKPVRPDVAVVDGVSLLSFDDASRAASRFSAVVVRENGRWVLSSVRESALPAAESAQHPLERLDWLSGSWESIGGDADDVGHCATRCSWNAGHSFLTRSHIVSVAASSGAGGDGIPALLPADGSAREISEIIGWDPDRAQIRSWVFSSDGRFAEGVWSRSGDAWQVRYEGRGADSGAICTATIERPGPDEIVIRAEPSALAEILPPMTDLVRTAYHTR
jgi:uncharacterized protein (TIGR02246 family)